MKNELVKAGYCASPNCPFWGELGHNWYPSGPGIARPPQGMDLYLDGETIRIYDVIVINPYPANFFAKVVAEFSSVADAINWMSENGTISEPGSPAYSNSWD